MHSSDVFPNFNILVDSFSVAFHCTGTGDTADSRNCLTRYDARTNDASAPSAGVPSSFKPAMCTTVRIEPGAAHHVSKLPVSLALPSKS